MGDGNDRDGSPGATDTDTADGERDSATDPVAALADREGWRAEGYAARLHYQGEGDRYSVEFYAPSECVLYWKVRPDGEVAVPVGRSTVPTPLRERVRQDLVGVGVAAETERQRL